MLFFRSEARVIEWCSDRQVPVRPIVTIEQLWGLALAWYATRLAPESRRPQPGEMVKIFAGLGLSGEFWDPESRL